MVLSIRTSKDGSKVIANARDVSEHRELEPYLCGL